jgi:peptidoglycan/LPS O-acetylase OafA/YrhL
MARDAERLYFPYIDGLRAFSIAGVVLYHLEPGLLPGGFGGVDIFFVVSGFIVSGSLHGRKTSGFFALVALFYARRFRRIVPALLFMLVATSLAVVLFIPEAFLSNNIRRTASAAFFGFSNFRLAGGPDYFSPQAEFNPFTHTWSLGVEEQFYLIFPALIFLLTSGGRIAKASAFGLFALVALSFAYGFVEPSMKVNLGFYSSFSRFWEIGAGVLLYWILARYGLFDARVTQRPEISIATYLGAGLIAAGFIIGNSQAYPVPGAALPVGGALLLIAALQGRVPMSPIGKVLSSRPAVAIGLISYSLYLWHWPVFVLFRWTVGFSTPALKLPALAIAVALSLISYVLVEKPLRTSPWLRAPSRAIAIYVLAVVLGAVAADRMFGNSSRFSASTVTANRSDWYPESRSKGSKECRVEWRTKPLAVGAALLSQRLDCDLADADARLFVVGDSHATAYLSLLADYARLTRIPVALFQTPGCYFVHLIPSAAGCTAVVDVVLDEIRKQLKAGDVVFMPSLRVPRFRDQWGEQELDTAAAWQGIAQNSEAGFSEAVAIFAKLNVPGVHFVFELPKPIFGTPLFRCSDWFNRSNPACSAGAEMEREILERHRQPVLAFADKLRGRVAGFSTWDPFPLLCPGKTCSMLRDGKPLFFDGDHVSGVANRLLLGDFMRKMDELGLRPR